MESNGEDSGAQVTIALPCLSKAWVYNVSPEAKYLVQSLAAQRQDASHPVCSRSANLRTLSSLCGA